MKANTTTVVAPNYRITYSCIVNYAQASDVYFGFDELNC